MKDILILFDRLNLDKLSFIYNGFINDEFTEKIIDLYHKNISDDDYAASMKNRIAFLIAESFQNIVKHGNIDKSNEIFINRSGIFNLRYINNIFYISSANLINNENIDALKAKLSQINELDEDKLKALQTEILTNASFSSKGGAGLGLVQMASKSGHKLEYEFEKVNEQYSYFYFQIKIKSKQPDDVSSSELLISSSKEHHSFMDRESTYLAYKGDFSQDNVLILLKIIERNLQVNPVEYAGIKKTIHSILTELLQNISKHAYKKDNKREGIFMFGKFLNKYILSTGNYIENAKSELIVKTIAMLNTLDKEALKSMFLDKIRNCDIDSEGNTGLGFIQVARESSDKIKYNISAINEQYSFLTINITI